MFFSSLIIVEELYKMADNITILMSGLPGKMATIIAEGIHKDNKYVLWSSALTGPNQPNAAYIISRHIDLVPPERHESYLGELSALKSHMIAIDACKGEGVANKNAEGYCKNNTPFVMLSTGADYKLIEKMSEETKTPCVAYPNMDPKIVAWMSAVDYMAQNYPGAFKGSKVQLSESHQADKKDTSGTMKNMLKNLSSLVGEELTAENILSIRDPNVQAKILGVPDNWLGWHAYHFFKTSNEHGNVEDSEELIFKRHGGECYRRGAISALEFIADKKNKKYFNTMIDVLKD